MVIVNKIGKIKKEYMTAFKVENRRIYKNVYSIRS
jgi:hypothetical protein